MRRIKILLSFQYMLFFLFTSSISVWGYTGEIVIKNQDQELTQKLLPTCSLCSTIFGKGLGSVKGLKHKAKEDMQSILETLQSLGYFGAKIDLEFKKTMPFKVKFNIDPGCLFTTKKIDFKYQKTPDHDHILKKIEETIDLTKKHFVFADYEKIRSTIEYSLKKQGFAHAKAELPELKIDHILKEVTAFYPIQLGEIYHFGSYEIEGMPEGLNPELLTRRFFWKKGDIFDISLIDKSKEEITDLQIFSVAAIETADEGNHFQKMKVKVKEGKPRTISGVLRYFSNEGIGALVSWRHKNFFDNAEQFDVNAKYAVTEKKLTFTLLKPDFLDVIHQNLFLQIGKINTKQLAYETDIFKTIAGLKYKFSESLSSSFLTALEVNTQNDDKKIPNTQYNGLWDKLISFPIAVKWDTRDSTSDPTKGWLSLFEIIPYMPTVFTTVPFQVQLQQTAYLSLGPITYGVNFKIGAFFNTIFNELPEYKQYFGGGDGSIRGYALETLSSGSGQWSDKPKKTTSYWYPNQGAQSKFEVIQELRAKINEDWSIVGFVDLGVYSKNKNPFSGIELMKEIDFETQESPLSVSFGAGINYLSLIGPVRLDFAFPLVIRKDSDNNAIDNVYQFYIRFGQGF